MLFTYCQWDSYVVHILPVGQLCCSHTASVTVMLFTYCQWDSYVVHILPVGQLCCSYTASVTVMLFTYCQWDSYVVHILPVGQLCCSYPAIFLLYWKLFTTVNTSIRKNCWTWLANTQTDFNGDWHLKSSGLFFFQWKLQICVVLNRSVVFYILITDVYQNKKRTIVIWVQIDLHKLYACKHRYIRTLFPSPFLLHNKTWSKWFMCISKSKKNKSSYSFHSILTNNTVMATKRSKTVITIDPSRNTQQLDL